MCSPGAADAGVAVTATWRATHPSISEFDGGDSHSAPAQSGTEALSDHRTGGKPGEGRDSVSEIVGEALGNAEEGWWGF